MQCTTMILAKLNSVLSLEGQNLFLSNPVVSKAKQAPQSTDNSPIDFSCHENDADIDIRQAASNGVPITIISSRAQT